MSRKWSIATFIGSLAVVALITATVAGWTTFDVKVSQPMAQGFIDQTLPKTKKGITVNRVVIKFDNHAEIWAEISGKKLGKQFTMLIHTIGQPDYTHSKNGEFYFRPEKVDIQEFTYSGKAPSEILRQGAERYVTNQGVKNAILDSSNRIEGWVTEAAQEAAVFTLSHVPVYKLQNDVKGNLIGAGVTAASVKGNHLAITFSFWSFTGKILLYVGIGVVCIIFVIGMVVLT